MTAIASAFARANLIGEHTDYNHGFVLPTPLPYETTVQIEKTNSDKKTIFISSENLNETRERSLDDGRKDDWTDYVMACFWVLQQRGIAVPPVRIRISSDVPMGAGLSSSAALLVATLRSLRALIGFPASDKEIALMANKAEREYVNVPCGIMDQFVSALGRPQHAFMLDTKHQTYSQVKLPKDYVVMLVNCGVKHRLASGEGYSVRVQECQQACKELNIQALRDLHISDLGRLSELSNDLLKRRAKHIITENQRVLDAVEALADHDIERFGELMAESHDSQRDDYECSVPEIDRLVESSRKFGVRAARLTGGGFGGSIVGFIHKNQTDAWWDALKKDNPQSHLISTYGLSKPAAA